MTAIEKMINERVEKNGGVLFAKPSETSVSLPSILDFLKECRDKVFHDRAQYGVALYRNSSDRRASLKYERATGVLNELDHYIDAVSNSETAYFVVLNMKYRGQDEFFLPTIRRVLLNQVQLFSAVRDDVTGHIKWTGEDKFATEATVETQFMEGGCDPKWTSRVAAVDYTQVYWETYFRGESALYARPKMDDSQYFMCKDCGHWFFLSDSEVEWYKEKGFAVPRRCYTCREARKESRKDTKSITMEDLI